jgi:hypothetical protein
MQQRDNRKEQGRKGTKKKAVKSQTEPETSGPSGTRKRVIAENGKVLIVDSLGDVYLEEEGEDGTVEAFLLDVNHPNPNHVGLSKY